MHAVRRVLGIAAAAALLAACSSTEPAEPADPPIYLALGDSWAAGSFDSAEGGYVNRLFDELPADEEFELRNLSEGGATTGSLIADQLPAAVAVLEERDSTGDLITVTIGGNDIFLPILSSCATGVTPQCRDAIALAFEPYTDNLTEILATLRTAAGEDADIVVTAYDNPIPNCFLSGLGDLGELVLEGGPDLPDGLNDITRSVAADYDAAVAETFGTLGAGDWVGGFDCLHPNSPGHEKVKDAFVTVLEQ